MNIVFSADNAYVQNLLVAMVSIMENNVSDSKINFYVLTADISDDNQKLLNQNLCQYKVGNIEFIFISEDMFNNFPLNIKHIKKEAYFRYVIADVLPQAKKALYLDADILVLGDLSELWETNIDDFFIAGSHKDYFAKEFPGYKEKIGLREDDIYINSGVILMNLEKIRKFHKVRELFDNTERLKDIIKIQDQDIINITFKNGIKNISNIYNYTESDRRIGSRANKEVIVVHFNTGNKPWNSDFQYNENNKYFADMYQTFKIKHSYMLGHHESVVENHVKRALIYVHYSKDDDLSEYVTYQLEKLKPFYENILILSNSKLTDSNLRRLERYAETVIERNNIGFDFAAWRDGMRNIGWETLETYDELTLMNDTCFGPIRDMSTIYERFNKSDEADFWGITNHRQEMNGMPGTMNEQNPLGDPIPAYIQTYFIAFKNTVIKSEVFQNFWNTIEDFIDIKQAIIHYETQLTKLLEDRGFKKGVLVEAENITMPIYAPFHNVCLWTPDILLSLSPFIKRKAFVRNKHASRLILPRLEKIDYPLRYVTEYLHSINEGEEADGKAKLIVIRGNSGSGKTTIARRLKEELFYDVMVIGWDTLRIDVFNRFDYINRNKYIFDALKLLSDYGRRNNFTVIIEGIYPSNQYKSVLTEICNNFSESHFYYFDISFEETIRRHETKNQTDFGVEELRRWHIEGDSMNIENEKLINEMMDEDEIVGMIVNDIKTARVK